MQVTRGHSTINNLGAKKMADSRTGQPRLAIPCFRPALTALLLLICSDCMAYDISQCNAVLEGDLFNKLITSSGSTSSTRQTMRSYMFSKNDTDAYKLYEKEYQSRIGQGQQGSFDANYLGIGGALSGAVRY